MKLISPGLPRHKIEQSDADKAKAAKPKGQVKCGGSKGIIGEKMFHDIPQSLEKYCNACHGEKIDARHGHAGIGTGHLLLDMGIHDLARTRGQTKGEKQEKNDPDTGVTGEAI